MKEKGITLIALVITIIVLLILATVSVVTLTGENGIISKAREAKEKTEIAEVIEKAKMDLLSAQVENDGSLTNVDLKAVLEKYFDGVPETLPDDLSTLTLKTKAEYGSHDIKLSDLWNGTTSSTTKTYTITYNANGGDENSIPQIQKISRGDKLSDIIPTRTGYTFKGWSTVTYTPGTSYLGNNNITLYAVWRFGDLLKCNNKQVSTTTFSQNTDQVCFMIQLPANSELIYYSEYKILFRQLWR